MGLPDSFYVGGSDVEDNTGQQLRLGQMYVRRYAATGPARTALPLVLLHGGAMNGSHWESTPDGRPGLAPLLAATGRAVYVPDLPGTGRSHYHPDHHGPLTHWAAVLLEGVFTAPGRHGGWPDAALHTQWPGTGLRGDPSFEAFFTSTVGSLRADPVNEVRVRDAGRALVELVGPCHLITHSQSGPYGWQITDAAHELVRTVIALEPQGPPWFEYLAAADATPRRPYGSPTPPSPTTRRCPRGRQVSPTRHRTRPRRPPGR